jgi:predicted DNA-binding antitoxin AbrB/MazE fold protein
MPDAITAVYENGVLRPLESLTLLEHSRVKLQIVEVTLASPEADEARRVKEVLIAAGLIKPRTSPPDLPRISAERREELARLFAIGGPLSELIIAEREGR